MNNAGSTKCNFSPDVVSYMYGELPAAECPAFESHLLDCSDCTDEFAAVSTARYEVYDWKKLEFEPLETPVFVIPARDVESATTSSWVDKLRGAFNQPWAVPSAAFAGLAIISAFAGIFYFAGGTGSDVARVNSNVTSVADPIAPVKESSIEPLVTATEDPAPVPAKSERVDPRRTATKRSVRTVRRSVEPRAAQPSALRTASTTAPRLNDFTEEEDTSLRLAQLFDDLDTRD